MLDAENGILKVKCKEKDTEVGYEMRNGKKYDVGSEI